MRHDYFATLNRLFVQNYARRCHDWCERHGLAFTGHFMEHQWPSPKGSPSTMAALRWMQAPGIDLLGFQFRPTTLADNALYLLNLKEVSSVAAQLGRARVLCESCGGGGYDHCLRDMKALEDFLLAGGVNLLSPHLSHQTLAGARKYDWPQTLGDHAPWWDGYGAHADHCARAAHALAQGHEINRILVLLPTTTGWLHHRPEAFRWPDEAPPAPDPIEALRGTVTAFLAEAYAAQLDYDLGDEFILSELGRAEAGLLRVGGRAYELVVLAPGTDNLTRDTLALLRAHLAAGGRVASLATPPAHLAGRPSSASAELAAEHSRLWKTAPDAAALLAHLRAALPPRLSTPDARPIAGAPAFRRVVLPDGDTLHFLCNPWAAPIDEEIVLEGRFLLALDTATGRTAPVATAPLPRAARQQVRLRLAPGEHVLWLARQAPAPASAAAPTPPAPRFRPVALELPAPRPADPNLLLLDYCDWEAGELRRESINTLHADAANWRAQGFGENPWRGAVQFRRTIIDAPMPRDSGFVVRHRFHLAPAFFAPAPGASAGTAPAPLLAAAGLALVVERAALHVIRVNGRVLDPAAAAPWFDEEMRLLPLDPAALRPGENLVELECRPFHILAEIMPIYLRGRFRLDPAAAGFVVRPAVPLALGDWTRQGWPFYPGPVVAEADFALEAPAARLRLRLDDWAGSLARLWIDGEPAGQTHARPGCIEHRPARPLDAGAHRLRLEIAGNLKNMLGPHFNDGLPGAWSWENCPPRQPPGSAYRVSPAGLFAAPRLEFA